MVLRMPHFLDCAVVMGILSVSKEGLASHCRILNILSFCLEPKPKACSSLLGQPGMSLDNDSVCWDIGSLVENY